MLLQMVLHLGPSDALLSLFVSSSDFMTTCANLQAGWMRDGVRRSRRQLLHAALSDH